MYQVFHYRYSALYNLNNAGASVKIISINAMPITQCTSQLFQVLANGEVLLKFSQNCKKTVNSH